MNTSNHARQHRSGLSGLMAVAGGLMLPAEAMAELVIMDIDTTINDNNKITFDFIGKPTADFKVDLFGTKGYIQQQGGLDIKFGVDKISMFAHQLQVGQHVDNSWFTVESFATPTAKLYDGMNGPWANIGAHGFVPMMFNFDSNTHYGWIELTRGSITVGRLGFNDTPDATASIPRNQVPAPGSLLLIASGAAGLLGWRRRQAATGQKLA